MTQSGQARPEFRNAHLEDVQHLEGRETLPWRWQFEYVVAVVIGRDRLDPFRLEVGEVVAGHHAAVRCHLFNDRGRDLATVECVTPSLLECSQRSCQTRIA